MAGFVIQDFAGAAQRGDFGVGQALLRPEFREVAAEAVDADAGDVEKYFTGLRRAQRDIDFEPDLRHALVSIEELWTAQRVELGEDALLQIRELRGG